jgi:hypothetical protein
MSTIGATVMTLLDWAKSVDPNGNTMQTVEMLAQRNAILKDMLWKPTNMTLAERTTVRTGLPTVAWRLLNQPSSTSKSTKAQIDEGCGMLEAWSEVDEEVLKLGGNKNQIQLSEGRSFIEAMNIEMAQTLFYGNTGTAPEEFLGLAPRYSDPSATNGSNIIDAGGSGSDNTSIWLCVWGENSLYGIFPQGSMAGLQHDNYGLTTIQGATGIGTTRMRVNQERWQWKAGIALKDWRQVGRIGSIDVSNLIGVSSAADIIEMMIKLLHSVDDITIGKPVFYMNRTVAMMLDILLRNDVQTGGQLSYAVVDGEWRYSFRGIPIRICDAILNTETAV